ncbi:MAG: alpha/beta fold hydrolase [Pseudomonadota bacterium]
MRGPLHAARRFADRARAFPPRAVHSGGKGETVVLLHGLGRTRASLLLMERVLIRAGYHVVNNSYPSRSASIDALAEQAVGEALEQASKRGGAVHFVTHSMGGILLRAWYRDHPPETEGRAVMLAPPYRGSEVINAIKELGLAEAAVGPAGAELAAGPDGAPAQLPDPPIEFGVIAGDRSVSVMSAFIPGRDDGKVSVASTMTSGAADHMVLPVTHTFLMNEPMTIWQTSHFLRHGRFDRRKRTAALRRDPEFLRFS